jgi:predicted dehydrogenase
MGIASLVTPHDTVPTSLTVHEIAEFVAAIQEQRAPASTVEQGWRSFGILDAIFRSAAAGAEVRL